MNLPGNVCRMYLFKRHCVWQSCRYRHCSREETQALREALLARVPSETQSEVATPGELPAPVQQDDPALKPIDDERQVCRELESRLVTDLLWYLVRASMRNPWRARVRKRTTAAFVRVAQGMCRLAP